MSGRIRSALNLKYAGLALMLLVAVIGAGVFSVARAQASSSVVHDPKGDELSATDSAHAVAADTPDDVARDYLDIKQMKVTRNDEGDFVFSMTLGGPVPKDMSSAGTCYGINGDSETATTSPNNCFFAWNWNLYNDPSDPDSVALSPTVRWYHGKFEAQAFKNQNPNTFDTFSVTGAHISATLSADFLANTGGVDTSGFSFYGVSRNYRINFSYPLDGVADVTLSGEWSQ